MSNIHIHIKHCPDLPKPSGGRPLKLSSTASRHIVQLISSSKAETAVDVSRILQDTLNTSISAETVQRNLKSTGLKSVVKSKHPLLSAQHKKVQLDFALAYKDWILEDWKHVIWSDKTKSIAWGQMGRSGLGKMQEGDSVIDWYRVQ